MYYYILCIKYILLRRRNTLISNKDIVIFKSNVHKVFSCLSITVSQHLKPII